MQDLLQLTAVDARRAEQANTSRAIIIEKVTFSTFKLVKTSHSPGGGVGEVGFVQPRTEEFECGFMAKGVDTEVFNNFGKPDRWVLASAYKNKRTGIDVPARLVVEGVVHAWEPDESSPSEFQGCNHTFAEITHSEFLLNGKELWYWDFWERVIRSNGIDHFASTRQALGA